MKNILVLVILFSTFNGFSQTQTELNTNANNDYIKTDKVLNSVYQKILSEYKSDSIFIDRLKKTQRIWMSYRDAELEMKFPAENKQAEYGSVYSMCASLFLMELTKERTEKLRVWLDGIEEGDVCSGSVKIIEEIESELMGKAFIEKDNSIWMTARMKKGHRIFGYKNKNINSEKMILLSVFTNEVENNPFSCKYGAFYDTNDMKDLELKYITTENEFLKIEILKNEKTVDQVYMLKKWFEFEK